MLSRSAMIAAGALAGSGLACLSVVVLGAPGSAVSQIDGLQARLNAIHPERASGVATAGPSTASLLTKPLFGQSQPVSLRLDGVSILPGRKAALVSVNGKPAEWLALGQTRDGVTLVGVGSGLATIESDAGTKDIRIGEGLPAAQTTAAANALAPPNFPPRPGGAQPPTSAPFASNPPMAFHNPGAGR